jgi:hypothetical protein
VTGHEATRDPRDEIPHRGADPAGGRWGWPGRLFRRVFGGTSKGQGKAS